MLIQAPLKLLWTFFCGSPANSHWRILVRVLWLDRSYGQQSCSTPRVSQSCGLTSLVFWVFLSIPVHPKAEVPGIGNSQGFPPI